MANKEREAQWQVRVARWRESGLPMRAFAIQDGYRLHQLSYWVHRLATPATPPTPAMAPTPITAPEPALLPVQITRAASEAPMVTLRSPSGWTVQLPAEPPARWLAELLRELA